MATEPLDFESLMTELNGNPWSGLPEGTCLRHVHLMVGDTDRVGYFFQEVLGFDLVQRYGDSASFFSVGGYHHHIAVNTWERRGAPASCDDTGLRGVEILLPGDDAIASVNQQVIEAGFQIIDTSQGALVYDPWRNGVLLRREYKPI